MSDRIKSEPPTDERRAALREQSFTLAQVTCPGGKERLGAVVDASAQGVALLVHTQIEIDDAVTIAVEIAEDEWLEVQGVVVRRDDVPRDGPWRYKCGVALDPHSEELSRHANAIREKYEARFGPLGR